MEELYEKYYRELLAFGTRMCGSRESAEDLIQETFIKALINAATVENLSPSQQRAWLYRSFKNLFIDRYRRAVLEAEHVEACVSTGFEDSTLAAIEEARLLQRIEPLDREIFELRYVEGYSSGEIAQMLHLSPGTIRSRLSRCRKRLKKELEL